MVVVVEFSAAVELELVVVAVELLDAVVLLAAASAGELPSNNRVGKSTPVITSFLLVSS